MKKLFLLMTILLPVYGLGGVSLVLADDTYEIKFKNSSSVTVSPANSTYFTYNKGEGTAVSWSSNGKHSCTYNSETYSNVIKMESATQCYFTVSASKTATVTIVQTTSNADDDKLKFDNSNLNSSLANTTVVTNTTDTYREYTITDVAAGTHTITRQSETGLAYVKVVEHAVVSYSCPNTDVQAYPYTWDFSTAEGWGDASTVVPAFDDWEGSGSYYHHTNPTGTSFTYPTGYDIDAVRGLRFNNVYTGLDWSYGHLWLASGIQITVPSLTAGQKVTILMEGREGAVGDGTATTVATTNTDVPSTTVPRTDGSWQSYEFVASADGDATFTFTGAVSIRKIMVTNNEFAYTYAADEKEIDGENRPYRGTFTFTEAGAIEGGTVFNDVPGIQFKVGAENTEGWSVIEASGLSVGGSTTLTGVAVTNPNLPNRPGCTTGCFFDFVPYVNGELTIVYCQGTNDTYVYENRSTEVARWSNHGDNITQTLMVEAGKTYTIAPKNATIYLKSFTFRPTFFSPGTTTDQLTVGTFNANQNLDKSAYPKLIASDQGLVRFSGDKEVVFLYSNNDVELLGPGTDVCIRGKVLTSYNDNTLVAYYLLNANVLQLVSTTPAEDAAYVDNLTDDQYVFTFNDNITLLSGASITVKEDADSEVDVTSQVTVSGANIYIPFSSLTAGTTYRITINANSIALSNDNDVTNAKLQRTFSVNTTPDTDSKTGEAPIKMIYPVTLATVGTSIVLETYCYDNKNDLIPLNPNKPVIGYLKADNDNSAGLGTPLTATFSANRLVFKPTFTLENNTSYTLTIYHSASNEVTLQNATVKIDGTTYSDFIYKVTHDKAFSFTTGTSSGTIPVLVSSWPADNADWTGAEVAASYQAGGTISFTFDQNVELEPYSTVLVTPINGSESTCSGMSSLDSSDGAKLLEVDSEDGKTVKFDFGEEGLRYDLCFKMVMPVNTVTGAGGKPNDEPVIIYFKMARNPNSTPVDAASFYPHTWDFNRLGADAEGKTAKVLADNVNSTMNKNPLYKAKNALQKSDQDCSSTEKAAGVYDYRSFSQGGYGWDQGADVYITKSDGSKYVLPEFEGLRVAIKKSVNNRFAIRYLNEDNKDGTSKHVFRMNGNTHYLTISNVPQGPLYMLVSAAYVGINTPNAEFVSTQYGSISNDNTVLNTNSHLSAVHIDVKEAGDVSFCVMNFNLHKMGVPVGNINKSGETVTTKQFSSEYENWVTDCQEQSVRYGLTNNFTTKPVTGYWVDADTYDAENGTITAKPFTVNDAHDVALPGEGVLISGSVSEELPLFYADYNSKLEADADVSAFRNNALSGISSGTMSLPRNDSNTGTVYYIFSNQAAKVAKDADFDPSQLKPVMLGYYRSGGGTISAHKSWLELPASQANAANAKPYVLMNFIDTDDMEDGTATAIRTVGDNSIGDNHYYSLDGRKLGGKPAKAGIYVINGKKIYVK